MKKAIILYGPPGSGKGTQADLLVRAGFGIHFDTGRYLRSVFKNADVKKDTVLKREKEMNEKGVLNTPAWVLKTVEIASKRIATIGESIVYSGSPRTLFEAFGEKSQKGLLEMLSKMYGKKNIFIIQLNVRDEVSRKRNAARSVCSVCGLPRLGNAKTTTCSFCAGPLRRRKDDNPKLFNTRLAEYHERTEPILARARKAGYHIQSVDGEKLPYKIHETIKKIIGIS